MRVSRTALHLLALLALVLPGCGREPRDRSPLPTGAPRLQRAAGAIRPFGGDATLTLTSPARVIVMYRRDGVEERTFLDVTLPGSRMIELSYTALAHPQPTNPDPLPPAQDTREGRTDLHEYSFQVSVEGLLGNLKVRPAVWTREGHTVARTWVMVPTLLGEEVAFGRDVELAAVAVADTAPGARLTLSHGDGATSAHVDPPLGPEDRLHVMRLILRVESVGGGRSETP